ncbi:hypothetical protein [Marinitenerispora sediminis]|uniref:Uncharacterized protein n=1 Tax=Marinitenerispora sediminis TaxID=1931232 RepID=A0A368T6M9_9ACTN|nr:hypothetical protein [Marinitenerispora sediminis]RCV51193.1 hypothetical protein DEF23_20940 [Marinitenerispora sediminis]RCV59326.1 hypothetical protein DEF24_10160 [Marinitenerispora sediminis]
MTFTPPPAMRRLLDAALAHGRSHVVQHYDIDSDAPWVSLRIVWPGPDGYPPYDLRLSWHTRDTGTYRLSHALGTWGRCSGRTITAARALRLVTGEEVPQEVADLEQWAREDLLATH